MTHNPPKTTVRTRVVAPREIALEHAAQRLIDELPNGAGWPTFDVAKNNLADLLQGRLSPEEYLAVMGRG